MATYHHLTGWNMPALSDGDVIVNSNLKGVALPMVKLHFIDSNLRGVELIDGLHTQEGCAIGASLPEQEPEPIDEFTAIKEEAKNKLLEVKPLAYENPLAVKIALSEAFTPEEFNGVMEAK